MINLTIVRTHQYAVLLGLLVLVGGFVRFWGNRFGLPHLYHPDEWALIMPALRILQTRDMNPGRFDYGSLHIYLLSGVYILYFLYGRSRGLYTTINDFPIYEPTHYVYAYQYPEIFIVGRTISMILGTLTIVVVYFIGKSLGNHKLGLVAALFLAFFPLHVVNSHYSTTDVPVTFFASLCFLFALQIVKRGTYHTYLITGLLVGLTTSVKYTGGGILVVMIIAHFLRQKQEGEGIKLFSGLLACGFGFAISTPYALLDLQEWFQWLTYVRNTYNPQGSLVEGSSAYWYLNFLLQSPYIFITLPGILGLIWLLRERKPGGWMIVVALLTFYGLISAQKVHHPRALIPLIPFLALSAGFFVVQIGGWLHHRGSSKNLSASWMTTALAIFVVIVPLWASIGHAYRLTQTSVHELTHEWVMDNLPPGTKIATDFAAPVLPPDQYQANRVGWSILSHELSWYQQEGYEYLIITEITRYSPNRTVELDKRYQTFLSSDVLTQVAEIEGHLLSYRGYRLWVYRLDK